MRRNVRQEFKESMDGLHFSSEAKEEMIFMLNQKRITQNQPNRNGRKLLLLSLAAATLLVTLMGAAVFTRWSRIAQNQYKPSEEIKEQADKSGLSTLLESSKETTPGEVLTVTDQGITITAVQTIIDDYQAELIFRVEGFDLPEGKLPAAWPVVTLDGNDHFYSGMSGWFFDGTTRDENGNIVYAETGKPVESDETGCFILDYVAPDGSMEYILHLSLGKDLGSVDGREINVKFSSFDFQSDERAGMPTTAVEGNWELAWTLRSTSDAITLTPNVQIGDSDVVLMEAEIGQMTVRTTYQLQEYWDGDETMEDFPQRFMGVRMKDGTEHLSYPSTCGYQDKAKLIYFMESSYFDAILDVSQVESLMFHKGWEKDANGESTIQTFYYIPVS